MAEAGVIEAKSFATLVRDCYILEGMFVAVDSVVFMRRRHPHNSTVFFTPFSTLFRVRFSINFLPALASGLIVRVYLVLFSVKMRT